VTGTEVVAEQASAGTGERHRGGRRHGASEYDGRAGSRLNESRGVPQRSGRQVVRGASGGSPDAATPVRTRTPSTPAQTRQREWNRQERRDPRRHTPRPDERFVDTGLQRHMAARLTVGEVPREAPPIAQSQRPGRVHHSRIDRGPHLRTPASARQLLVLLSQLPPGAEQAALHHLTGHVKPLADLVVGESVELAEHEQLMMGR
jgi:hypothetical protein